MRMKINSKKERKKRKKERKKERTENIRCGMTSGNKKEKKNK